MDPIKYKASPTAIRFHKSDAFVRGIKGPFGSGKSVACCFEIFLRAKAQHKGKDGIRRSRWIVARNTQPQLETTTIKTWLDWFPEETFGKMSRKPPFTHRIQFDDIDLEVIFLALDKPEDVKKLLSFEVTGFWFNEAREIDYELVSGATGRAGRYPSPKDKPDNISIDDWPKWRGVIMDTNPPTDEHWWYKCAVEDAWAVNELGEKVSVDKVDPKNRWQFFDQPGGLHPDAENIENLPGGRNYYTQQIAGKSKEWIKVYVNGEYGFIKHGMPVYGKSWNNDVHAAEKPINIRPSGTIYVGIDSSGRHPAAIFLQKTLRGQIQVVHELCITDDEGMGAQAYARLVKAEMQDYFPKNDFEIWGDPAGGFRSQNDERTYFDILRAEKLFVKPSPGLRVPDRLETVMALLDRNVDGQPALIVSPDCKLLIRGFNGGYRYRKLQKSGEARYDEKPEKNRYSDVQDALQYVLCGMGEMNKMFGRTNRVMETKFANIAFKI